MPFDRLSELRQVECTILQESLGGEMDTACDAIFVENLIAAKQNRRVRIGTQSFRKPIADIITLRRCDCD